MAKIKCTMYDECDREGGHTDAPSCCTCERIKRLEEEMQNLKQNIRMLSRMVDRLKRSRNNHV